MAVPPGPGAGTTPVSPSQAGPSSGPGSPCRRQVFKKCEFSEKRSNHFRAGGVYILFFGNPVALNLQGHSGPRWQPLARRASPRQGPAISPRPRPSLQQAVMHTVDNGGSLDCMLVDGPPAGLRLPSRITRPWPIAWMESCPWLLDRVDVSMVLWMISDGLRAWKWRERTQFRPARTTWPAGRRSVRARKRRERTQFRPVGSLSRWLVLVTVP